MNGKHLPPACARSRTGAAVRAQTRQRSVRWLVALLATAAVAFALAHGSAHAQPAARALILPATAAESARYSITPHAPQAGVVRQKPVRVDAGALDDSHGAAATELQVELFDGQSVTITRDRLERRGPSDFTWLGKVRGHPNGFALLTVVDGRVSGMIEPGGVGRGARARYQILSSGDGSALLQEIDAAAFPDDHPGGGEAVAPDASGQSADLATASSTDGTTVQADGTSTIDVMIVYSNQTAVAAGSAIGAQAQQAIDTANLVYANSGITTRLRLVYAGPANYDESGDFSTDLNRLTGTSDGYMDGVHALRGQYGADLVSLFIENGQYCGMGWIGPSAAYAFSVVNRGCASGNYSFPHELGHNFGARHDTYVDAATTPYAYGHGWVDV
ncbi:MAG TPA: M12 family metallo-peptidase, partial [Casimicrobiaceae bacterium]